MFVDASAIVAILTQEPDYELFIEHIDKADPGSLITSVLAAWEAVNGLSRIKGYSIAEAEARVRKFLSASGIQIVGIAPEELTLALLAFDRYGRHRLPPEDRNRALNLADCFHYACAKSRGLPILHKDLGLKMTDVASVNSTH